MTSGAESCVLSTSLQARPVLEGSCPGGFNRDRTVRPWSPAGTPARRLSAPHRRNHPLRRSRPAKSGQQCGVCDVLRIGARHYPVRRGVRTRACRHSSESKQRADEIDGGGEAGIGFVVTGGDAAELLEALEEVLDQVTPLIHFCV